MTDMFSPFKISFLLLISCLFACQQEINDSDSLTGSWELISWTATSSEGEVEYPYGENAFGKLTYLRSGEMSLTLSARNRKQFGTYDHTTIDPQIVIDAFDDYFTYVGDYEIDWENGKVKHQIEACLFPDWEGKSQERHFELKDKKLYLKAYNKFGKDHVLTWARSY